MIQHPAIRNAMKMLDMHEIRLTYEADLPARSGLGTSSSFAVGMLNAFYALKGKYADKKKLADEAIYLERELCKEAGGWQDQIAASFGGFNRINFSDEGYEVLPVIISPERKRKLNQNLMMFFTGFTRFSSDVQKANTIGKGDKTKQLKEMLLLVDEAEKVLTDRQTDLNEFGRMLDHTWKLKRQTGNAVSTSDIDLLYEKGMKAGALGGKLLGAGGGGFLVFYVEPDKQDNVKNAMDGNAVYTDEVEIIQIKSPEIIRQPKNAEGKIGSTIVFSVEAANVKNYEWQYKEKGRNNWITFSWQDSYDTAEFKLPILNEGRLTNTYRCKITGEDGSIIYTQEVFIYSIKKDDFETPIL